MILFSNCIYFYIYFPKDFGLTMETEEEIWLPTTKTGPKDLCRMNLRSRCWISFWILSKYVFSCNVGQKGVFMMLFHEKYVMHCAICYLLYNSKNLKNTHGGVLLLVVKVTVIHGCFSSFLNCANGTKLLNTSQ